MEPFVREYNSHLASFLNINWIESVKEFKNCEPTLETPNDVHVTKIVMDVIITGKLNIVLQLLCSKHDYSFKIHTGLRNTA